MCVQSILSTYWLAYIGYSACEFGVLASLNYELFYFGGHTQEGIPVCQPSFYDIVTPETLSHILRSDTDGQIPLMEERWRNVKEAGDVIKEVSK